MHVVIVSMDLAVVAKATAICTACQASVATAMSRAKLAEVLPLQPADVILIDLQTLTPDAELVRSIRQQASFHCILAAFGPHVQEARLQAAVQAGCDHVWSRGQWPPQLQAMLGPH